MILTELLTFISLNVLEEISKLISGISHENGKTTVEPVLSGHLVFCGRLPKSRICFSPITVKRSWSPWPSVSFFPTSTERSL